MTQGHARGAFSAMSRTRDTVTSGAAGGGDGRENTDSAWFACLMKPAAPRHSGLGEFGEIVCARPTPRADPPHPNATRLRPRARTSWKRARYDRRTSSGSAASYAASTAPNCACAWSAAGGRSARGASARGPDGRPSGAARLYAALTAACTHKVGQERMRRRERALQHVEVDADVLWRDAAS